MAAWKAGLKLILQLEVEWVHGESGHSLTLRPRLGESMSCKVCVCVCVLVREAGPCWTAGCADHVRTLCIDLEVGSPLPWS